jgi:tRNA acetyltransferase TAN1
MFIGRPNAFPRKAQEAGNMMRDFNMVITTQRGAERKASSEMFYLLKTIGDAEPAVKRTPVRGLLVARTSLDPVEAVTRLRLLVEEKPYEFHYVLRVIPVERVVCTCLDEVKQAAAELASRMRADETFRVTVEKRFTSLHSREFIEAAASVFQQHVCLTRPDWILLIEVIGESTGISLLRPDTILAVLKAKML